MEKHEEKLKEQFIVEQFLDARQVFTWDPLEFKDENHNKIDDRIDAAREQAPHNDEVDEI